MPHHVCNSAQLTCTMGSAASALIVPPTNRMLTSHQPGANILDHQPLLNIQPFGLCRSRANPVVANATDRALGRLTPMPCIPNTPAPWVPGGATVVLGHVPALDQRGTLKCVWAGVITVELPGQSTLQMA